MLSDQLGELALLQHLRKSANGKTKHCNG